MSHDQLLYHLHCSTSINLNTVPSLISSYNLNSSRDIKDIMVPIYYLVNCEASSAKPIVINNRSIHRTTTGTKQESDLPRSGLVRDGTPCGENLICLNQTCTSIFPHMSQEKCPSNTNSVECSGHGVSYIYKCICFNKKYWPRFPFFLYN